MNHNMHNLYKKTQLSSKEEDFHVNSLLMKNIFSRYDLKSRYLDLPVCTLKKENREHFERVSNNSWYDTSTIRKKKNIYLFCREMRSSNPSGNENLRDNDNPQLGKNLQESITIKMQANSTNIVDVFHSGIVDTSKFDEGSTLPTNVEGISIKGFHPYEKTRNKNLSFLQGRSPVSRNTSLVNMKKKVVPQLANVIKTKKLGTLDFQSKRGGIIKNGNYSFQICKSSEKERFKKRNGNINNFHFSKLKSNTSSIKDSVNKKVEINNNSHFVYKRNNSWRYFRPYNVYYDNRGIDKGNEEEVAYFPKRNIHTINNKNFYEKKKDINLNRYKNRINEKSNEKINTLEEDTEEAINNTFFATVDGKRADNIFSSNAPFLASHIRGGKSGRIFWGKSKGKEKLESEGEHIPDTGESRGQFRFSQRENGESDAKQCYHFEGGVYMCKSEHVEEAEKEANSKEDTCEDAYNETCGAFMWEDGGMCLSEPKGKVIRTKSWGEEKKRSSSEIGTSTIIPQMYAYMKKRNYEISKAGRGINILRSKIRENRKTVLGAEKYPEKCMSVKSLRMIKDLPIDGSTNMEEEIKCASKIVQHDVNKGSGCRMVLCANVSENISLIIDFKIYKPILMKSITQVNVYIDDKALKSIYINEYPQSFSVVIQQTSKINNEKCLVKMKKKLINIKEKNILKFIYLNNEKAIGCSYISIKHLLCLGIEGGIFLLVNDNKKESKDVSSFLPSYVIPFNKQEINILKSKIFFNYKILCPKFLVDSISLCDLVTTREKISYLEDMVRQMYNLIQDSALVKYMKCGRIISEGGNKTPYRRVTSHRQEEEKAEVEVKIEAQPGTKVEGKVEAKLEAQPGAKVEAKAEAQPGAKVEAKAEAQPGAKVEAQPGVKVKAVYEKTGGIDALGEVAQSLGTNSSFTRRCREAQINHGCSEKKQKNEIQSGSKVRTRHAQEGMIHMIEVCEETRNSQQGYFENIACGKQELLCEKRSIQEECTSIDGRGINILVKNIGNNDYCTSRENPKREENHPMENDLSKEKNKKITNCKNEEGIYNSGRVEFTKRDILSGGNYIGRKINLRRKIIGKERSRIFYINYGNKNKKETKELNIVIAKYKKEIDLKRAEIEILKHSNSNTKIMYKACFRKLLEIENERGVVSPEGKHLLKYSQVEIHKLKNVSVEKETFLEGTLFDDIALPAKGLENEEIKEDHRDAECDRKRNRGNIFDYPPAEGEKREAAFSESVDVNVMDEVDAESEANCKINDANVEGRSAVKGKENHAHFDQIEYKNMEKQLEMLLKENKCLKEEINKLKLNEEECFGGTFQFRGDAHSSRGIKENRLVSERGHIERKEYFCQNILTEEGKNTILQDVKKRNRYSNNTRFNFPLNFIKNDFCDPASEEDLENVDAVQ
ncbi:conserved Plasmodium protein, unknown function [Plasmodium ovale curtisi]|uniref:Uncharacterized protein n=1 Tax=Plasmodium ovale curtisi TaxID=864141 RepID=A0A1A8WRC7_PLAOA|nr:conserved Plasmodium protein, unknown function [Plasmodium ovale curtisi]